MTSWRERRRITRKVAAWRKLQQPIVAAEGREKYLVRVDDWAIGRKLFVYGEYDFRKFLRAMELLGPRAPGVIFDVGANVGSICIPAVRRGYMRSGVAFEPESTNYALLAANVRWNGLADQIRCLNFGLSDASSESTLVLAHPDNAGSFRIGSPQSEVSVLQNTIVLRRFDDLKLPIDPASDLLWLDVEGHEVLALRGMVSALESRTPVVLEFTPSMLQKSADLTEILALLHRYRDLAVVSEKIPRWESAGRLRDLWNALIGRPDAQVDILLR